MTDVDLSTTVMKGFRRRIYTIANPLVIAGMQCVLDKASAPVCALAFGRLDSALLAFGADDGIVRVARISEQKASILHVRQSAAETSSYGAQSQLALQQLRRVCRSEFLCSRVSLE